MRVLFLERFLFWAFQLLQAQRVWGQTLWGLKPRLKLALGPEFVLVWVRELDHRFLLQVWVQRQPKQPAARGLRQPQTQMQMQMQMQLR